MKQTKEWFFPTNKIGEDEKKKKTWHPLKRSILSLSNLEKKEQKNKKTQREILRGVQLWEWD